MAVLKLHNTAAYDAYLSWLGDRTRLKLLSPAFNPEDVYNMADAGDTNMEEMKYFKGLREHCQRQELAPVINWMVSVSFQNLRPFCELSLT